MSNFGILFDLDGTLVNSLKDITGVVNAVRKTKNLPPLEDEEVRVHIGKGIEHLISGTFPGFSEKEHRDLISEFKIVYHAEPFWGGSVYPGVLEGLKILRSYPHIKLAIATNKPIDAALKTLNFYIPEISFDFVAGPETVSKKKPAPEHLLEVLRALKISPERACFIGDDPVDLKAAQAAKIKFFGASYGYGGVITKPENSLKSFLDLIKLLPSLGIM